MSSKFSSRHIKKSLKKKLRNYMIPHIPKNISLNVEHYLFGSPENNIVLNDYLIKHSLNNQPIIVNINVSLETKTTVALEEELGLKLIDIQTESKTANLSSTALRKNLTSIKYEHIDVLNINLSNSDYSSLINVFKDGRYPRQLILHFLDDQGTFQARKDRNSLIKILYKCGYRRYYENATKNTQCFFYMGTKLTFSSDYNHSARPFSPLTKFDRGVVYIAFGYEALTEANLSVKSLKTCNPNIGAAIFTDKPQKAVGFDIIHTFSPTELHDIEHFFMSTNRIPSLKVRFLGLSPFLNTIHLDCDTYIKGSLEPFFDAIDDHHFVLTNMPELEQGLQEGSDRPVHQTLIGLTRSKAYSCAVFGYRKGPQTNDILQTWWTQFVEKTAGSMRHTGNWNHTNGTNEQKIMHQMLADGTFERAHIKVKILPNIKYNAGMSMWPRLKKQGLWKDCCILHSHKIAQKIGDCGIEGLPDLPELQKFL